MTQWLCTQLLLETLPARTVTERRFSLGGSWRHERNYFSRTAKVSPVGKGQVCDCA